MTLTCEPPVANRWHWIRLKGQTEWFPAFRDAEFPSAGGWSNQDCWEDFHDDVIEWKLIELPNEGIDP